MKKFYLLILAIFFISFKVNCQISSSIQKITFKEPISNVFSDSENDDKVIYTFNFNNESGFYIDTGTKIIFEHNEIVQDLNYGNIITVENLDPKTEESVVRLYSITENELRFNCSISINSDYLHAVILNKERVLIKRFDEGSADFSIELYDYNGNFIENSQYLPKFGLSFLVNSKDYFYYYVASNVDYIEESPQKCLLYKVDSRNATILNEQEIETTGRSELHDGGNVILLKAFDNIMAYDTNLKKIWQINDIIGYNNICPIPNMDLICIPTREFIYIISSINGQRYAIVDNHGFLLQNQKSSDIKKAIPLKLRFNSDLIMLLLYIETNDTEEINMAFYNIKNHDIKIERLKEKFYTSILISSNGIWKLYTEKYTANINIY